MGVAGDSAYQQVIPTEEDYDDDEEVELQQEKDININLKWSD